MTRTNNYSLYTTQKRQISSEGNILYGDVNGDNDVSSIDATLIQRYLDDKKLFDEKALESADVDMDGYVTSNDSKLIQKYLSKSISKLPFRYGDIDEDDN